jgi:hypothetical protein
VLYVWGLVKEGGPRATTAEPWAPEDSSSSISCARAAAVGTRPAGQVPSYFADPWNVAGAATCPRLHDTCRVTFFPFLPYEV